jgi:hypothetical protein
MGMRERAARFGGRLSVVSARIDVARRLSQLCHFGTP